MHTYYRIIIIEYVVWIVHNVIRECTHDASLRNCYTRNTNISTEMMMLEYKN